MKESINKLEGRKKGRKGGTKGRRELISDPDSATSLDKLLH